MTATLPLTIVLMKGRSTWPSMRMGTPRPPPPPMAHIAQPRPVLRRECLPRDLAGHSRVSFESQRRFSWESR
ncbi:hypothetical protein KXW37_000737 [Aspergillus fumigatus]|nr:hypothetical protein KXW37_000737 [Aspergillus fumigatus]